MRRRHEQFSKMFIACVAAQKDDAMVAADLGSAEVLFSPRVDRDSRMSCVAAGEMMRTRDRGGIGWGLRFPLRDNVVRPTSQASPEISSWKSS